MRQEKAKKDKLVLNRMNSSGLVTVDDELKALDCVEYVQQQAVTDCVAAKMAGITHYKFWSVRQQRAEIAALYQLASDARAQYHVERSVSDLDTLADEIRTGKLERSAAHALVSLARTQHQASLRYAELTDRKRWSPKIELSTAEDFDFSALIEKARDVRKQNVVEE